MMGFVFRLPGNKMAATCYQDQCVQKHDVVVTLTQYAVSIIVMDVRTKKKLNKCL